MGRQAGKQEGRESASQQHAAKLVLFDVTLIITSGRGLKNTVQFCADLVTDK